MVDGVTISIYIEYKLLIKLEEKTEKHQEERTASNMLRSTQLNYFLLLLIVIFFLSFFSTKSFNHGKVFSKVKSPRSDFFTPPQQLTDTAKRLIIDVSDDEEELFLQGLTKEQRSKLKRLLTPLEKQEAITYLDNMNKKLHEQNKRNLENNAGKVVTSTHDEGSLAYAIEVFNVHLKDRGEPLSADDPRQVEHWNNQTIGKTKRTILYKTKGEMGKIVPSSTVSNMKRAGTTQEQKETSRIIGNGRRSESSKGREQMHAVESTAIACFLHLCSIMIPEVFSEWEVGPVFDGLQADLMMRHKSFPDGIWVPIQMKSARIEWGRKTNYFRTKAEVLKYKEVGIYCIAVGLLEYDLNYNPNGPDDLDYSAKVYEILDNREYMTVCPYPATLCEAFPPQFRCFVRDKPHDCTNHEEYIKTFLTNLFANIQNWHVRYSEEDLLYGRDTVNARCAASNKIENVGIEVINKAVVSHGGTLQPPWRQGETVDSIMTFDDEHINISHKTANIIMGESNQRGFKLKKHPNDHFCDLVIASYSKQLNKVAVMSRSTVYDCGNKTGFYWNEKWGKEKLEQMGVFIFDLENEEENAAFIQLFREYVKNKKKRKTDQSNRANEKMKSEVSIAVEPVILATDMVTTTI